MCSLISYKAMITCLPPRRKGVQNFGGFVDKIPNRLLGGVFGFGFRPLR
ncbi:hypothetical protein BH11CYA1_BH11CYA1_31540 [soil metagenome]